MTRFGELQTHVFLFGKGQVNLLAHYFLFSVIISCFDKLRGRSGSTTVGFTQILINACLSEHIYCVNSDLPVVCVCVILCASF